MIFLTKAFMKQISVWILHICSFSGKSILNLKATRAPHQIQWKYTGNTVKKAANRALSSKPLKSKISCTNHMKKKKKKKKKNQYQFCIHSNSLGSYASEYSVPSVFKANFVHCSQINFFPVETVYKMCRNSVETI